MKINAYDTLLTGLATDDEDFGFDNAEESFD
jgi:hypothetical protein